MKIVITGILFLIISCSSKKTSKDFEGTWYEVVNQNNDFVIIDCGYENQRIEIIKDSLFDYGVMETSKLSIDHKKNVNNETSYFIDDKETTFYKFSFFDEKNSIIKCELVSNNKTIFKKYFIEKVNLKNSKHVKGSSSDCIKENEVDKVNLQLNDFKISQLPIGDEILLKYFKKTNFDKSNYFLSDEEDAYLNTGNDKSIYNSYQNKFYKKSVDIDYFKYPQKNNYDFGKRYIHELDSIKTNKDFYSFSTRLPDIGFNEIYLAHSKETESDINFDFFQNIDLLIINKENIVINSLNLNYWCNSDHVFLYQERPFKHFYIDSDYIVHIKYFIDALDGGYNYLAYIKYKIQDDGSIIRYFEQKDGSFKSYIEEGTVKNNTKEGKWKEYLGGHDNMYAILNYKNGIVDGKIEIFDTNDMPDMSDPEQTLYPRYVLKLEGDKYVKVDYNNE